MVLRYFSITSLPLLKPDHLDARGIAAILTKNKTVLEILEYCHPAGLITFYKIGVFTDDSFFRCKGFKKNLTSEFLTCLFSP